MAKHTRSRVVTAQQTRSYLSKAEEFIDAATAELAAERTIAATSLAIHAAINAADAVTGARTGRRAAGPGHDEVLALLRDAGRDGMEVERNLVRLLPMKTRAEYEPDAIAASAARTAVDRARRCVDVARKVVRASAD
jgi:HEPN domain-containing protein